MMSNAIQNRLAEFETLLRDKSIPVVIEIDGSFIDISTIRVVEGFTEETFLAIKADM